MQPLLREYVSPDHDLKSQVGSLRLAESESNFDTFGGIVLASVLGLYCWAALFLLMRWIL